jgi:hypothetical protein
MKKCIICNEIKPYDDFHKHSNSLDGRINKCKPCLKQYYKDLKDGKRMSKEEVREIRQHTKEKGMAHEREITNYMLRVMGYEPDSLISVHEQFLMRHLLDFQKQK